MTSIWNLDKTLKEQWRCSMWELVLAEYLLEISKYWWIWFKEWQLERTQRMCIKKFSNKNKLLFRLSLTLRKVITLPNFVQILEHIFFVFLLFWFSNSLDFVRCLMNEKRQEKLPVTSEIAWEKSLLIYQSDKFIATMLDTLSLYSGNSSLYRK